MEDIEPDDDLGRLRHLVHIDKQCALDAFDFYSRHEGLIRSIIRKYYFYIDFNSFEYEEICSDVIIPQLCYLYKRKNEINKFHTVVIGALHNEMKTYTKRKRRNKTYDKVTPLLGDHPEPLLGGISMPTEGYIKIFYSFVKENLGLFEQKVFELLYIKNMQGKDVAESLHCSEATISSTRKKIINYLKSVREELRALIWPCEEE